MHGSKSTTMPHAVAVTSDDYNLRLPGETRRRCSTCILGGRTEREKGVSGMQAERASVNGCKLQRGGDKCPASVLNELRLKEDKVSNRLKALDIASIIYKMNAKTGYL